MNGVSGNLGGPEIVILLLVLIVYFCSGNLTRAAWNGFLHSRAQHTKTPLRAEGALCKSFSRACPLVRPV